MDDFELVDALTGDTVIRNGKTGQLSIAHSDGASLGCKSLFFPGCSMINYAMPLVNAVFDTLVQHGEADGISLLCCGKILSFEPNGEILRASFVDELKDHIADAGIKRVICACPNCMKALTNAFSSDERTSCIELIALPQVLASLGYKVDGSVASRIVCGDEHKDVLLCVHDSCPDRDYGLYARGLREVLPSSMFAEPKHCRRKSVCCGSLPRAAGNNEAADKCANINAREALEVKSDAIVTACMSCTFQLNMAQKQIPAYHFLELLYDWPINWAAVGPYMQVRFLFDNVMGATALDANSARKFEGLG